MIPLTLRTRWMMFVNPTVRWYVNAHNGRKRDEGNLQGTDG